MALNCQRQVMVAAFWKLSIWKYFFLLFVLCVETNAQTVPTDFELKIEVLDESATFLQDNEFDFKTSFTDSLSLKKNLNELLQQLQARSYLAASVDRLTRNGKVFAAQLHVGAAYKWAKLKSAAVEEAFLDRVGFKERLFERKPFHYVELRKIQEALLVYAENNGYPFATVSLEDIEIREDEIMASLKMEKNRLIVIDGINLIGDVKISDQYLENYLGLKQGTLYSKAKIKKIRTRIRELAFLQEKKDATVTFKGDKATINLFLTRKKSSRFDFLLGVLPNTNSDPTNPALQRRLLITGTFNADLYNQFGLGERLFAEFQQLSPGTQELDLQVLYPYVLDLPFGLDLKFSLYKRDSTFLDVETDLGFQYIFEGGNYVKAFWNNTSSSLLQIEETRIRAGFLPRTLDVRNSSFGLEYNLQKLDYRFNPRKGWHLFLRGAAGIKNIKKNATIVEINESLYDSLELRTFQYKLTGQVAHYFPLGRRGVVKTSLRAGFIISENPIYQNEQFRLGGNRLLRGFDEESIFSTNYVVSTLEYRFIIGQNSYFYLFGDYAYLENITPDRRNFDQALGLGVGITFETKVGVFGLSYALGKQQGNPFDFRAAKIHFGYVSLF